MNGKVAFAMLAGTAVFVGAGCAPALEVSVTPDGGSVFMAKPDRLDRASAASPNRAQTLARGVFRHPRVSPDGRWLLVQEEVGKTPRARWMGLDGRGGGRVQGLNGPFAWSPDGSEFVGYRASAKRLEVVHPRSGEVVRTVPSASAPGQIQWMPGGRDLFVVHQDGRTSFVRQGRLVPAEPMLDRVAVVAMPDGRLRSLRMTEQLAFVAEGAGAVRTVSWRESIGGGRFAWPAAAAYAPGGERIAVVASVETSDAALGARYEALLKKSRRSPAEEREMSKLDMRLTSRLELVVLDAALRPQWRTPLTVGDEVVGENTAIVWSGDGSTVVVSWPERWLSVRVPPAANATLP